MKNIFWLFLFAVSFQMSQAFATTSIVAFSPGEIKNMTTGTIQLSFEKIDPNEQLNLTIMSDLVPFFADHCAHPIALQTRNAVFQHAGVTTVR